MRPVDGMFLVLRHETDIPACCVVVHVNAGGALHIITVICNNNAR
jgi:hypothetical protein